MTKEISAQNEHDSFAALYEQSIKDEKREGSVVKGRVTKVTATEIYIDVGLKSEGRVVIEEFEGNIPLVDDSIDVYIERLEDRHGSTVLSREKALKEEAWFKFEELYKKDVVIEGQIIGRVKGGFAVDIGKIIAFLPGSQVDIRPIKDISPLMNLVQPFKILKMDNFQGNIVVSRRAILEESRAEARDSLLSNISEGSILEGAVKNITDYGAFIDLGSIDGLLHITDISWDKISHPSEVLSLGQQVKVMVIKYNPETKRVSLGLKQLEKNPWEGIADTFQPGTKMQGTVTTITDYGAFVEVGQGIEGLVYHTEISWNSKNTHPRKLLKTGDKVEVMILELDIAKHKISLSIKQCKANPWKKFEESSPVGTKFNATVQNVADFGIFVLLDSENPDDAVEALIPAVELSWDEKPEVELKKYKKGDRVSAVIVAIDPERERILASIKQTTNDEFRESVKSFVVGESVTCTVSDIKKEGIEVELPGDIKSFIKKSEISKHRSEQRPDKFGIGDKIDAKIISIESKDRSVNLSIKALEIEDEKKAIAEYGSKDSGASLGEILGMALNKDKESK